MQRLSHRFIEKLYASIYLIRKTEEEIARIYSTDKIKSPVHLSIGQEAVSVGVCSALKPLDAVFGTYRGHALYLAKGGDLNKMIAELYGKSSGCAKGRGGSMHLIDIKRKIMGTSAIVGTTIPVAAGYAYGLKYKKSSSVAVSFFGDGAVDEGAFHETMNFAVLKKLPLLFICENNFYAIHSHHLTRHPIDNLTERAISYGMPAERISDGDIFKIYQSAGKHIQRIRNGGGPAFLECVTCRWKEHVGPNDDFELGYRDKSEVLYWQSRDQLKRLRGLLPGRTVKSVECRIERKIREAFKFAEKSAFPKPGELREYIFKG